MKRRRATAGGLSRAAVRAAAKLACLLVLIAPVWLGPAMMPVVHALGGVPEHRCACGMQQGECGCPECQALAHQRLLERRSAPYPVVHGNCNTDAPVPAPAIPTCSPAGVSLELAPVARVVPPPRAMRRDRVRSRGADEPPTPPPRDLAT